MNVNVKNSALYETNPEVSGLNKVSGFDPRKFMRKVISELTQQEIMYLDLKYKKLWFRIAYPKGKIQKTVLKINEQIAIIEAKVFFNKDDAEPVANFIAQRNAGEEPGYIEAAQYAAENQALVDAGFGLQFCDILQGPDNKILDTGIPVDTAEENIKTAAPVNEINLAAKIIETSQPISENEKQETVIKETTVVIETEESVPAETMTDETQISMASETIPESQPQNEIVEQPIASIEGKKEYFNYTNDMPVEEILKIMTLEEAGAITVDEGVCKGWLMSDVMDKRPASLKWYLNGYTGKNNIMKAAAQIMFDYMTANKAA